MYQGSENQIGRTSAMWANGVYWLIEQFNNGDVRQFDLVFDFGRAKFIKKIKLKPSMKKLDQKSTTLNNCALLIFSVN